MLAAFATGLAEWTEQGPGPLTVSAIGTATGALENIVIHPTMPVAIVGGSNGGIWRTMDITASPPVWEPLGDQLESLSIRSVAFSPLDPTGNTVYAGSGRSSAGFGDGGAHVGIFRSTDLGLTWTQLAREQLLGQQVRNVIPTGLVDPVSNLEVVLVATSNASGGIFRSTDGGVTFVLVSGDGAPGNNLPTAGVSHLVADPGNPGRYYAGVLNNTGAGVQASVYRSDDYGQTWNDVGGPITDLVPQTISVDLSVHNSPGNNVIYAAITRNDQPLPAPFNNRTNRMSSLWRSIDGGQTWRQVQNQLVVNPGAQGGLHFAMTAHPTDPNVLFIGGDAPVPDDGAGTLNPFASSYMSRYRVTMDDVTPANDAWTPVADFGANGTRPHADARDFVFDANGDLIEVDDGGIYRLNDPDLGTRTWEPLNGNLRATEFFSVAYDSLNETIFGGTQDNGTPRQRDPSDPLFPLNWIVAQGADGGVAGVDNDQTAHPNETYIYTVSQNLGSFTRRTIDDNSQQVATATLGQVIGTNNTITGIETTVVPATTVLYMTPYAVNAVQPAWVLVGTNYLYESTDSGANFTSLGGLQNLNGDGLDNDGPGSDDDGDNMVDEADEIDEGDEFRPLNPVGQVNGIDPSRPLANPIAYGGRSGGVDNPNVLWIGAMPGQDNIDNDTDGNTDEADERMPQLLLRTAGNGLPTPIANYSGGQVLDVAMDPEDWHVAFILDSNGAVYKATSNNDGSSVTFETVTGNLGALDSVFRSLEVVRIGDNLVVLVGGNLGVFRAVNPTVSAVWSELGGNLPNAPVNDIRYDATDDVLLAGTFGRGAWTIEDASLVLLETPVLNICGDEDYVNQDDTFLLIRDPGNPLMLQVFINGSLEFTAPLAAITQINVFGVGGNDNLIVDSTNGLINVPLGIRYNGDGQCPDPEGDGQNHDGAGYDRGFDRLTLLQTDGPTHFSATYSVGPQIGSGTYSIVGAGLSNTQTIFFEELEPIVDVVPVANYEIFATAENNTITVAVGPNSGLVNAFNPAGAVTALVTIDNYESVEFSNKGDVSIRAGSGNDHVVLNRALRPDGLMTISIFAGNGHDTVEVLAAPAAAPGGFQRVIAFGDAGNDVLDARFLAVNTPVTFNGNEGNDTVVGGRGDDLLSGEDGDDTLIGGDPSLTAGIGNNTFGGGAGFDTIVVLGTLDNDIVDLNQGTPTTFTARVNANTSAETFDSVEQVRVEAKQGNDLIRITTADALGPTSLRRYDVQGDAPNASDRLIVNDAGLGDLVLIRQAPDSRSGRVSVAPGLLFPPPEVVYAGIERLDIGGQNPITGGTGVDGLGRVVVFQPDEFELNDNRLIATDIEDVLTTHRDPTIDPGGNPNAFGPGDEVEGDEDWYEFRAPKIGTFRFDVLFDQIPGLPASGNLDAAVYDAAGNLIVLGTPTTDGEQVTFSADGGQSYFLRVRGAPFTQITAAINTYDVRLVEVDLLGPQVFDPDGAGPLSGVHITDNPGTARDESLFDLFNPKPTQGPTPLVKSLTIHLRDLVSLDQLGRAPGDIYDALDALVAGQNGHYQVRGDANGIIPIENIVVSNSTVTTIGTVSDATPLPAEFDGNAGLSSQDDFYNGQIVQFTSGALAGQARVVLDYAGATRTFTFGTGFSGSPANGDAFSILPLPTATIELVFASSLPDDRFTLTVSDTVLDPAGNKLDGESNFSEPHEDPSLPSGDGVSGGDFVARFTVDTRPELGGAASGSIYVDTNGNFQFDPTNPDFTNRDITYLMGFTSDNHFAGNFVRLPAGIADGFDKLGAYGKVGANFRWILDTDNDGVRDVNVTQPLVAGLANVNGMPAAGNFDGNKIKGDGDQDDLNGDEVVLKVGNVWILDTNHDFKVETKLPGNNMVGLPIVGDFDGDGRDDLGAWADDRFRLNLSTLGPIDGFTDVTFTFGFAGTRERPIAADFDSDGIDDLGLWVPDRGGVAPSESAEWYLLISGGTTITARLAAGGGFLNFTPTPFGNDRFAQFGDQFGLPVVGNFDPPLTPTFTHGSSTNTQDSLDVNNDGALTPLDVLAIVNTMIQRSADGEPAETPLYTRAPFVDVNGDGNCTSLDVLSVVNGLIVQQTSPAADDDGEGESAAADAYFASLSESSASDDLLLAMLDDAADERDARRRS